MSDSKIIKLSAANSPTVKLGDSDMIRVDKQIKNLNDSVTELKDGKVDKENGKGLSSNDFTDDYKNKLDSLENYDDTDLQESVTNLDDSVTELDSKKADKSEVPTKVSELENDYGYMKTEDYVTENNGFMAAGGYAAYGVAIGQNAEIIEDSYGNESFGVAIGPNAKVDGSGGAIGYETYTNGGGSIGFEAKSGFGFSGGYQARVAESYLGGYIDAIQLGCGTNSDEGSLQIYDYKLMDADGNIPNERMPTKEDKTTITTSTDTTASVTLNGNTEKRYSEVTSLTVAFPKTLTDGYISSIVFTSGSTVSTITIPSNVYMQGTDCSNGVFTPTANKRYTIIFSYDGEILSGIVNGIPKAVSE